jgi:hypothetical protein
MTPSPLITATTTPNGMGEIKFGAAVVTDGRCNKGFHELAPKDDGEDGMESKEQGKHRSYQAQYKQDSA